MPPSSPFPHNRCEQLSTSQWPVIQISHLQFAWKRGAANVLDIPALAINQGERVFLQGSSGSGKSTLLSLVAGVSNLRNGELEVLGQDLRRLNAAERDRFRADHIGIIFQMFNLIPYLSVVENVTLPCRFSPKRRDKALQRTPSLRQEAIRLLDHLDMADGDLLHRPVNELSVGQQQRVAAARALMGAPELVIADEPTSSLDADRRTAFIDLLFRECDEAKATLVFVSHDASLRTPFDRSIDFNQINRAITASSRCLAAGGEH
jgi:putative ABC transport system ATP-binding protein